MSKPLYFFIMLTVLISAACKQKSNTAHGEQHPIDTSVKNTNAGPNNDDPNLPPQNLKAIPVIDSLVEIWAKKCNAHDASALSKLYAPKVDFYTERKTGSQIESEWTQRFSKKDPHFGIQLIGKKDIRTEDNGIMLALFQGQMHDKSVRHYQMRMKQGDGTWKITFECYQELLDIITKGKTTPPDPKNIKSCDDAIDAVLRSSPSISGLLGQPNARRVTEFKPGDKNGPYGKYQIAVWGYRPGKDIEEKLGTFQLEVKTGELFELKEPDNKPNSVPYDMQFKKYIQKYCKSE